MQTRVLTKNYIRMKKALALALWLAIASPSAFAQLPNGSIAPNWTLVDNNNVTWDLYTVLAQGKTVFIDVVTTWDQNGWNYHASGTLNQLNAAHGPSGSVDTMCAIFLIEGDGTTTNADLNGTGSNTYGDWVTGSTYNIIDLPLGTAQNQAYGWTTLYAISGFPTMYMICPNQLIYNIGQLPLANLVSSMNTCPYALDALPTSTRPSYCATTINPEFTLKNNSSSVALTSCMIAYQIDAGAPQGYVWTGNLIAGGTTYVTLPSQTLALGNHLLTVGTSAPNGGTDDNANNDSATYNFFVASSVGTLAPYTQDFTISAFPYANWVISNPDTSVTWAHDPANGGCMKYDTYNYMLGVGEQDEAIVELLDLSLMSTATLTFDVAHAQYSPYIDALDLMVSTDCGATWTTLWSKSGATLATVAPTTVEFTPASAAQWRTETVSLAAYVGQSSVSFKFVATNGYSNNIYVDNIDIMTTTSVADAGTTNEMNVFPNPADDNATIMLGLTATADVTINVYSMTGALVATRPMGTMTEGEHAIALETANLEAGMYIVEVASDGSRQSSRLIVQH